MPRIALCQEQKKDYMVADLPFWIEKEAKKRGIQQRDLAAAIGITPQSYGVRKKKKQNGEPRDSFSYGELLVLLDLIGIPDSEKIRLFTLRKREGSEI